MSQVVKYLGDKTPYELGMQTLRKSARPVLPPTTDRTVTIPHMHGAYDFGADMGPRPLPLDCAFMARNSFELQRRIDILAAHLIDGDGRPRSMPLIFSDTSDRQFIVRYSGSMDIVREAGLGLFTLPFTAFDPYPQSIYDLNDINVDSLISVDSDIFVDAGAVYSISKATTIPISNFGTLNVGPIVEVSGSFTTLSLTVGGVEFTYNTPMTGTLIIDFAKKTVKIGTTSALLHTNRRFGILPVGVSNIVVGGTGLNCTLSIHFNAKFA